MKRVLFVLSLLTGPGAFAADILDSLEVPDVACNVRFLKGLKEKESEKEGVKSFVAGALSGCSATLIGAKHLALAAHCLPDPTTDAPYAAEVFCGGKRIKTLAKKMEKNPKWDKKEHLYDLAVIETQEAIDIEPAKLPRSADHAKKLLKKNDCLIFGFGKTAADRDAKARTMRGLVVAPAAAKEMKGFGAIPDDDSKMMVLSESEIEPGDSGGGVLCREDNGRWYLISVTSAKHDTTVTIKSDGPKIVWSDGREVKAEKLEMASFANTAVQLDWFRDQMMPPAPKLPKRPNGLPGGKNGSAPIPSH